MISRLRGLIDQESLYRGESVILDVNGVGYEVFCSEKTKAQIPQTNDVVALYIETHVREDRIQLFGFVDLLEKRIFKELQIVQGVGMKAAMALLSAFSAQDLYSIIQMGDAKQLTHADGIGPKIANRIVTELQEKISSIDVSTGPINIPQHTVSNDNTSEKKPEKKAAKQEADQPTDFQKKSALYNDAVSALTNLGYKPHHVRDVLTKVMRTVDPDEDVSIDELIRLGLKELAIEIA